MCAKQDYFKADWAVISTFLWMDSMRWIHTSQLGIEAYLSWARECIYCTCMNVQLRVYIEQCEVCKEYSDQQQEILQPDEIPTWPWEKIRRDLFIFNDCNYMVTVDYCSSFGRWSTLKQKLLSGNRRFILHIMEFLTCCFQTSGPEYIAAEFKEFSAKWEYEH